MPNRAMKFAILMVFFAGLIMLAGQIIRGLGFTTDSVGATIILIVAAVLSYRLVGKSGGRGKAQGATAACPGCGYDLTGNVSGVCPECGRPVGSTATGSSKPTGVNDAHE